MPRIIVDKASFLRAAGEHGAANAERFIEGLIEDGILRRTAQEGIFEFVRHIHAHYFWAEDARIRAAAPSASPEVPEAKATRRALLPESSDLSREPLVIVLHGPSGVGKDAVIDRIRARAEVHCATSTTSRPPRPYEVNGNNYHFVSEAEFEEKIRAGEFVEWARVYDDYKGLERREVEQPLREGRDVIIRTDVQGARTWRERLDGAIFIFLMAEDRDAILSRLHARGSAEPSDLARRIAELEEELDDIENNDYVVYNRHGELEAAAGEVIHILERERRNPRRRPLRWRR